MHSASLPLGDRDDFSLGELIEEHFGETLGPKILYQLLWEKQLALRQALEGRSTKRTVIPLSPICTAQIFQECLAIAEAHSAWNLTFSWVNGNRRYIGRETFDLETGQGLLFDGLDPEAQEPFCPRLQRPR